MSENRYPSQKLDQYMLRLPDGMRDRIKAAAEANNRSMNAEIVSALEKIYPAEPPPSQIAKKFMLHLNGLSPKVRAETIALLWADLQRQEQSLARRHQATDHSDR